MTLLFFLARWICFGGESVRLLVQGCQHLLPGRVDTLEWTRIMQSELALMFWILPLDLLEAGVELPFCC